MNMRVGFLLGFFAAAGTAFAQPIYKSIGPDGRTMFSDRPPADANVKVDVVGAVKPPEAPSRVESFLPEPRSSGTPESRSAPQAVEAIKVTAKKAIRNQPHPPAAPSDAETSSPAGAVAAAGADVEKAVIGVMGYEDLIAQMEDVCVGVLPTSFVRFGDAVHAWKARNAAVLERMHRVLAEGFGAEQRKLIEAGVKTLNHSKFEPIVSAPAAAKIKWCDQSLEELRGGKLDVHNKIHLAEPLVNYPFK